MALAAWALFPLVLLLAHAAHTHTTFTGADGLIGADGVLGADQLQYLAWVRDAGSHGLASDLFTLAPSGHVYLEPLFTISGALWRARPVAAARVPGLEAARRRRAVLAAAVLWARRFFGAQLAARAATVVLSLFLYTPLAALFSWAPSSATASFGFQLYLLADELLAANKLWGYVPSAFGLALVPVALLAVERALEPERRPCAPSGGGASALPPRRAALRALLLATAAALLSSWLHPWQGITLILIFAGLAPGGGSRRAGRWRCRRSAPPCPLAYYYLLSHTDPAWKLASTYEVIPRLAARSCCWPASGRWS